MEITYASRLWQTGWLSSVRHATATATVAATTTRRRRARRAIYCRSAEATAPPPATTEPPTDWLPSVQLHELIC